MTRLTWAGKTLIQQVGDVRPDATTETGEPDGLGVIREITFDRATGKWLKPFVDTDPRITSAVLGRTGGLVLTFQPGPIADQRDPFPIPAIVDDALIEVASEKDDESADDVATGKQTEKS